MPIEIAIIPSSDRKSFATENLFLQKVNHVDNLNLELYLKPSPFLLLLKKYGGSTKIPFTLPAYLSFRECKAMSDNSYTKHRKNRYIILPV